MTKYVKHLTLEELAERLARELVDSHLDTGIDLGYWETARELVERFYDVRVSLIISKKEETNGQDERYLHRPTGCRSNSAGGGSK
jgi:hypothetical protein